jgi:hypothetical protein
LGTGSHEKTLRAIRTSPDIYITNSLNEQL